MGRALPLAIVLVLTVTAPAAAVSWGPVSPITTSGQAGAWAGSTAAYTGGIAVVYREIVDSQYRVFIRRTTDGGVAWTTPRPLSSPFAVAASRPSIVANGLTLDAVFVEERTDGSSRVTHRRSLDGGETWEGRLALSPAGARVGFPSVARSGDKVAVAWTNERSGTVGVRVSTNGGQSFFARTDIATSTNKPWVGDGVNLIDAFPTVAIANGMINVGYYTSPGTLKLRRAHNAIPHSPATWFSAVTLANNGNGFMPRLVSSGTSVLLGYAVYTGTDTYTAYRRSTNKGQSWSSVAVLSGASAPPSYQPVMSYGEGKWRVAFERCLDEGCSSSDVLYRESADGVSWSAASRATNGPNEFQWPIGVAYAGGIIVTYATLDAATDNVDLLLRKGS
jgi:hypothetical protein